MFLLVIFGMKWVFPVIVKDLLFEWEFEGLYKKRPCLANGLPYNF